MQDSNYEALQKRIQELEAICKEKSKAHESYEKLQEKLKGFLSENQLTNLMKEKIPVHVGLMMML